MHEIYLDHNATTPVDPEVVDAMLPYLGSQYGNASSVHQFGRTAKVALETAREEIASFINCDPAELLFTSGGTESDNLAVLGIARQRASRRNHLVVGATEHHAVLEPAEWLHHEGAAQLALAPVDQYGFHALDTTAPLLTDKTALLSIMHANNETGAIQPLAELAGAAHAVGALLHTDAVQTIGKIPVDVRALGVDLLTLTAHKIYGPKGIGALFVRSGIKLQPLLFGGSHEKKRRPGTEHVAGAAGFAKALSIARARMDDDFRRITALSNYFIEQLKLRIGDLHLNSPLERRIPQTINLSIPGVEGEPVILSLDMEGIAVSSGSACTSGATQASHVLVAMGIPNRIALGAIRFSLGRHTTQAELDRVLAALPPIVERLRSLSPART